MTNTHSIEELKNVEIALSNLVNISRENERIGGLLQMVHTQLKGCQSDIVTSLIIQDIDTAEKSGVPLTDQQKVLLMEGAITSDDAILENRDLVG